MATPLEFRVLGPVTVLYDGVPVDLGGPQRRALLTVLLVHANQVVPTARIAGVLWGGSPPPNHRVQLQGLVSDLRRRLAAGAPRAAAPIETVPPGYRLRVPDAALDLAVFRDDVRRAAGDAKLLAVALDRWTGPAYGGFDHPDVHAVVAAVEEERWSAVEAMVEGRLSAGRLTGLADDLRSLARDHPLRESLHRQLMVVLARTSRVGEALAIYRDLRARMVDGLGVEPSAPVRRLHRQLLLSAAEPAGADGDPDGGGLATINAYRQLPPDLAGFVGRAAELDAIVAAGRAETGARIVVLSGMAGVGKTRLALRAAYRLVSEGRFDDGQLYLDLASDSGGAPVGPAAALAHLLRLLGVRPDAVPPTAEARATVLRDRLAGHRVLLVLDGAVDERQVLPLLAAGPTSFVMVASRRVLAIDGALHLSLSMFDPAEAVELLTAVAGADRVTADPAATDELIDRCGRLPLAVTIAAHRLRTRPAWPVRQLVGRLRAQDRQLDELTVGGRAVETVFRHAYESLPEPLRRLFRRLSLHPGVDVTDGSAAALAGVDPHDASTGLEELLDHHLVIQSVPGRYGMHDLLRAFAAGACRRDEPDGAADAAVADLLDWYAAAVDAAVEPLRRFRVPVSTRVPPSPVPTPRFASADEMTAWLDAEFPNLLALVRFAGGHGRHAHAILLPHLLRPYFIRHAPVTDWLAVLRVAEAAARRAGELSELAHTLTEMGHAHGAMSRADTEIALLRQAVELHELCGDDHGRAVALNNLGTAHRRLGRYEAASDLYRAALDVFEAHRERERIASTATNLAIVLHLLGRDDEAIRHAEDALRFSSGAGEASIRTNLGRMYARTGRHADAVEQCERALHLFRAGGSRPGEAAALTTVCVGEAHLGRFPGAIRAGRLAAEIARRIANPEVAACAFNSLGEAYALAGRHSIAERRHRRALALVGEHGEVDERDRAVAGIARAVHSGL